MSIPLYEQLAETLRDKMYAGEYTFGDSLPSERAMAAEFGISHLTVRKALSLLEEEGLIVRIQGKGTFVKTPRLSVDMQAVGSFSSILSGHNTNVTSKVLYSEVRPARTKYARIFGVGEESRVYVCEKLKSSNGVPLAIEQTVVPLEYVPDVADYDYSVYSLYDVYRNNNIRITREDQYLEIVKVYNPIASILGKEDGDTVFLLSSDAYDDCGRIVERTRMYDNDERLIFYLSSTSRTREG